MKPYAISMPASEGVTSFDPKSLSLSVISNNSELLIQSNNRSKISVFTMSCKVGSRVRVIQLNLIHT